jgi:glycosyltransferase involved in cell wall biosynthesis
VTGVGASFAGPKSMNKVLVISNTAWNIFNFRANLISAFTASGLEVVAVAPVDAYSRRIPSLGCRYIPLEMDNKGTNPLRDVALTLAFLRIFRRERPSCILCFTIKPNVYGSIAAGLLKIPIINNVAGLGTVFSRPSWVTSVAKLLYKHALRKSHHVFFQNDNDLALFKKYRLATHERLSLLPGSGVDTSRFKPQTDRRGNGKQMSFLLLGRLLWEKGVREYVDAAKIIKAKFAGTQFGILGFLGAQNPFAVPASFIKGCAREGWIHYLGDTDDVIPFLAQADCIVLPSYYGEGTPRALLEAASMGKPIITTDMPGCRDVVEHGKNGFLVKTKDVSDLVAKMEMMIQIGPEQRSLLGKYGREKMVQEFDDRIVTQRYLQTMATIAPRK